MKLTTHVLDTAHGCPANGLAVTLTRVADGLVLQSIRTNADGRADTPLLEGDQFQFGIYELSFAAGDYFRSLGLKLPASLSRASARLPLWFLDLSRELGDVAFHHQFFKTRPSH